MAAESLVDLVINQRASFEVTYFIQDGGVPLDLTDYTAVAKLKQNFQAPDNTAVSFDVTVNAAAGSVILSMDPDVTSTLSTQKYVYDLSITNTVTGYKIRIAEGSVKVSGGVS